VLSFFFVLFVALSWAINGALAALKEEGRPPKLVASPLSEPTVRLERLLEIINDRGESIGGAVDAAAVGNDAPPPDPPPTLSIKSGECHSVACRKGCPCNGAAIATLESIIDTGGRPCSKELIDLFVVLLPPRCGMK